MLSPKEVRQFLKVSLYEGRGGEKPRSIEVLDLEPPHIQDLSQALASLELQEHLAMADIGDDDLILVLSVEFT